MGVGTACTVYEPVIVLEALVLTATVVLSLTAYTFYAARKGHSFSYLGPILFTGARLALSSTSVHAWGMKCVRSGWYVRPCQVCVPSPSTVSVLLA